ncbi:MAG: sulfatase-like hydrolase/transferase, partial [Solirubrobacterales bacterium]
MSEEIGPDGSGREAAGEGGRPPNLLLVITDQQRPPMHWPDEPGWVEELLPADAELRRTGASFENACVASCMCSPSRASLLTGRWPAEHGVELTLTQGGA